MVRNRQTGPGRGTNLCRCDPQAIPRQAARLQLLTLVQLETQARRQHDRPIPARIGSHGLQVPIHHARRIPCFELLDVRFGERLPRVADVGLRGLAGSGVQGGETGLFGHAPSARSGRGLLRRRDPDHRRGEPPRSPRCPEARKKNSSTRRPTRAAARAPSCPR
jgi:hypothetical protein